MRHKQGEDRNQMFMFSLESAIASDSFVRVVDAFVDATDLKSFGFSHVDCEEEGRPPYHPSVLLKLYLYGYRHGIRTSRKLEREAQTNFNDKKLKRHLDYIENQIKEYEALLETNDKEDEKKELEKKIAKRREKQAKYEKIKTDLENSNEEQISLTDPDSRSVMLHRNIINVGYNIQASSDAKHKLLVEYDTGDVNDTHALAPMAMQTKEILGVNKMNVLADKGYHTGEQLEQCHKNDITTFVSPKAPSTKDIGLYPITSFVYDKEQDCYICPQGNEMHTNGTWHRHSDNRRFGKGAYSFQRYNTPACKTCKRRSSCTQSKTNGRYIDRSEYAEIIEANAKRVEDNPDYYRQRQQVTEHMFGTLKRQRGFTHTLVRKKDNVLGEVG